MSDDKKKDIKSIQKDQSPEFQESKDISGEIEKIDDKTEDKERIKESEPAKVEIELSSIKEKESSDSSRTNANPDPEEEDSDLFEVAWDIANKGRKSFDAFYKTNLAIIFFAGIMLLIVGFILINYLDKKLNSQNEPIKVTVGAEPFSFSNGSSRNNNEVTFFDLIEYPENMSNETFGKIISKDGKDSTVITKEEVNILLSTIFGIKKELEFGKDRFELINMNVDNDRAEELLLFDSSGGNIWVYDPTNMKFISIEVENIKSATVNRNGERMIEALINRMGGFEVDYGREP